MVDNLALITYPESICLHTSNFITSGEVDNSFCVSSVKIMAEKLDPEQLGVITLNSFMEEFYASEKSKTGAVQSFVVYHYNGLPRSCSNNKVSVPSVFI